MSIDFEAFGLAEPAGSEAFWQAAAGHSPHFIRDATGWQALFLHRGPEPTRLRFDDRPHAIELTGFRGPEGEPFQAAIVHFPAPFRVSYGFAGPGLDSGLADPLNPVGAGPLRSIASTPDAVAQPFWPVLGPGALLPLPPIRLRWHSILLNRRRTVRMQYIGPAAQASSRVLLLLDGDDWIHLHPAASAFAAAHRAGHLDPCTLVFIPAAGGDGRRAEYAINPVYWQAVRTELLPLIADELGRALEPAGTVLAGQSYGGLAALYAAVTMPETFPRVLCQSGSFWYPAPMEDEPAATRSAVPPSSALGSDDSTPSLLSGPLGGQLARILDSPELDLSSVKAAFDVGRHEGRMQHHQAEVLRLLRARGAQVRSEISPAGHDRSSWRHALLHDACWMLSQPMND